MELPDGCFDALRIGQLLQDGVIAHLSGFLISLTIAGVTEKIMAIPQAAHVANTTNRQNPGNSAAVKLTMLA
jgi:hypothetical protein